MEATRGKAEKHSPIRYKRFVRYGVDAPSPWLICAHSWETSSIYEGWLYCGRRGCGQYLQHDSPFGSEAYSRQQTRGLA